MKDLWINKWRPSIIEDVIGNKQAIKDLESWLSNFENHTNNSIIITGLHGIGKTLVTKLLLNKYKYNYKIIYPDDLKTYRLDNDFLDFYNYENSINNKVNIHKKNQSKLSLIFDETESISLTSERKFVFEIYKNNSKYKVFPLIFISNNNHSKLLNDLKKYCKEIKFIEPSFFDLAIFIKKICKKEKIKIENNSAIQKLVEFSQKDIRRLLNILQEYSYNYKILNNENVLEFIENSVKKNTDIGLYEASIELLNNYHSYDDIYRLYETEKVLLPLMIHENYYKKILASNLSQDQKLESLVNVSDSLSKGDNVETSIYTDQNWYLQNIHGFYTCLNTSFWINKDNNKKIEYKDIKFSADLNKTSLKNINKKNINNLQKIIYRKNISEILLLNDLSNKLYESGNIETLINILKTYKKNTDIKDVELCLKIDKTKEFNILSPKEKKELLKYLVE
jgi:replication factor C subunit 1